LLPAPSSNPASTVLLIVGQPLVLLGDSWAWRLRQATATTCAALTYCLLPAPVPQVKKENPDAKLGEMAKIIGEMWKGLSDKEKEPYQKKADAEKVRQSSHWLSCGVPGLLRVLLFESGPAVPPQV
jgi:hypothetical protein